MKKSQLSILLVCAAIVIFILGVIFGFFVSPSRYKIESNGRIKLDTITGRVWIYNSEKAAYLGEKQMQAEAERERLEKEKRVQAAEEWLENEKQMRAQAERERLEKEKQVQAEAERERLERVKQMQAAEAERLEKEKQWQAEAKRQVAEWEQAKREREQAEREWQEAIRRLVVGMTKDEVKSICGVPEKTEVMGGFLEIWEYSHGSVTFSHGKLDSWR